MKTGFSEAARADPAIAAADPILRACVHCGFCAPACPTYRLTGDELDGPRGRVWLIRDLLESGDAPEPAVVRHLDRCLGCLGCMPACPSGVDYRSLIGIARERIEQRAPRRWHDRLIRRALARILPDPALLRCLMGPVRALSFAAPLVPGRAGAALRLIGRLTVRAGAAGPGTYAPGGTRRGRVMLLAGCVQSVLAPAINAALIRVANRQGFEVVVPGAASCCGALSEHLGDGEGARAHARKVIAAVMNELDGEGLDAVLQTASGCGTLMKAYGKLMAAAGEATGHARRVAALVRDGGEWLAGLAADAGGAARMPSAMLLRVAWQAPCSLANAQGAGGFGAELLRDAGFEVADPGDDAVCCGSAGAYNLVEPNTAERLRAAKAARLDALGAALVVSSNIGCMAQLSGAVSAPVVHLVELIDWAQGGPVPAGTERVLGGPGNPCPASAPSGVWCGRGIMPICNESQEPKSRRLSWTNARARRWRPRPFAPSCNICATIPRCRTSSS